MVGKGGETKTQAGTLCGHHGGGREREVRNPLGKWPHTGREELEAARFFFAGGGGAVDG